MNGDPGSFDEFYRQSPRVVTYLVYCGAELEAAKDAVQEAMLTAYQRWGRIQHPHAWIRRVAWRNWFKRLKGDARTVAVAETQAEDGVWPPRPVPDDVNLKDEQRAVIEVLYRLPGQQRVVMALSVDGLGPFEIADFLEMTPSTVRSNLRHARRRLEQEARRGEPELREEA